MSEEILINVSKQETRVAIVENGILQEIYVERNSRRGIVGNIYKGRVTRVMPGMQAAFVDIGLDRSAFIHTSDIVPFEDDTLDPPEQIKEDITELLYEGQEILVQVAKTPWVRKGRASVPDYHYRHVT